MRRLPPWMLGGASTGEAAARNGSQPEAPKTKAEKRPKRVQKTKEKDLNLKSDEPKRVPRKIREEAKRSPEVIQSVTVPEDDDLTVDDLLSFANEYVQRDEEGTRKERERSLSVSETTLVLDETNMTTSSQGGTKDSTAEDMLQLLMGPFYKKR
ncbi:unnamed protein product [Arabidopsis thaliana]|uniref:Uncharacterized protein At3g17890 n=2 Tax=Arabidopsis TaxID=3701 RepID=Q9LVI1_ARATH|nr:uncharacterized protein AT3G17890 [Arabidopsis thaliana]NP_001325481.1 uncharacterized protein AT3G17890 [Arabidopsis thaliana]NP_188416.2 uncharacterized protein AT3G17890 [Arabidopsis thaliana]KAG7631644.1 hypothetical protein ISN44_As03g018570 [Arabidopsis suecica]AAO64070.1 unknown protein [Arabidopsis thaliana]AEE76021.1 hypothetical protein AT3G17890 [Arabidopsis thaliana]ANM63388.1 hypothetical protein AT3G17890 [Arabidopsis thaliana]ANM63389.1 hypothetical protein AT3G17890 [Arabi|eukprot:NP_001325480.1 hypothetical protein AT3G17890 [Arabidopsis thaliana]